MTAVTPSGNLTISSDGTTWDSTVPTPNMTFSTADWKQNKPVIELGEIELCDYCGHKKTHGITLRISKEETLRTICNE